MEACLDLKVVRVVEETEDAKTFIMHEAEGKEISFLPGQFLTLIFDLDGEEQRRTYSICTSPFELPDIGITVKKSGEGFASDYFVSHVKEGDRFRAFQPLGKFTVEPDPDQTRDIVLIGAGSGITPLMSILKTVLFTEPLSRIFLYYGNRHIDSIIFRKELNDLVDHYTGRLKIRHILSRADSGWVGLKGRMDEDMITFLLQEDKPSSDAHYFICGPSGLMESAIAALKNSGIEITRIHTEYFHVEILQNEYADEADLKERKVTIIFEGKEHIVSVPPYDSILTSALEKGIDLPNSCQMGQCGSCMAKIISGKINLVEQSALSEEQIRQGYCLTCVGFPMSDDIVIDFDETSRF